jgi:uncharacterized membrane protein
MTGFRAVTEIVGTAVDAVGVLIVVVGAIFATDRFLVGRRASRPACTGATGQDLGRAILLRLELLVAGDNRPRRPIDDSCR